MENDIKEILKQTAVDMARAVVKKLDHFISGAIATGFTLPFFVAVVAANGSMLYLCIDPTGANEEGIAITGAASLLTYHLNPGEFRLPFCIELVDSRGEAVHMVARKNEFPSEI